MDHGKATRTRDSNMRTSSHRLEPGIPIARWALMIVIGVMVNVVSLVVAQEKSTTEQLEFFESRIRPVLVENCYKCHNSSERAESDFVIDHRAGIRKMLDLESPEKSRLLKVIRHEIEDLEMPEGGTKLPPIVVTDFLRWIESGAPDPRDNPPTKAQLLREQNWDAVVERRKAWWCFQPILNSAPPRPGSLNASDHPVDLFILEKLATHGLATSPPADPRTLLRRLTYAITGLPPTLKQQIDFQQDHSPRAFEILVTELLDSEQYAERWSRHWMDWIRFAESHGSEGDPAIPYAYRYRDYLVRAIQQDVPYDQLVREHIAGDLLPNPRVNKTLGINESAIATAHWRMVFHGFAPTDAMEEKIRFTDDQINVFSKAFLGLTVSCARCHNHKFDAISQADYYALFGILDSTRPGIIDVNDDQRKRQHIQRLTEIKGQLRQTISTKWLQQIDAFEQRQPNLIDAWTKAVESAKAVEHPLYPLHRVRQAPTGKGKAEFEKSWQATVDWWQKETQAAAQHNSRNDIHRWGLGSGQGFRSWFSEGNGLADAPSSAGSFAILSDGDQIIQEIYPAGVYSHLISTKHRGVLMSPRIHLDQEYDLWLRIAGDGDAMARYAVQHYPRSGTVYPVTNLQKGNWRWQRYSLKYWQGDDVHIEMTTAADAPVLAKNKPRSWFAIREAMLVPVGTPAPPSHPIAIHKPLFELVDNHLPDSVDTLSAIYVQLLRRAVGHWRDGRMSDEEAVFLNGIMRSGLLPNQLSADAEIGKLVTQFRQLEKQIPSPTRVVGLIETKGKDQPLLIRGSHKSLGQPVPRGFLKIISPHRYNTTQSGRLELAQDVLSSNNPLTARVIVNRIWHHLFGIGLVATPDNFGKLGAQPTHPELLDYLANRMIQQGWSIKEMVRFLVLSKTWQQSSTTTDVARRKDPENQWLSHAHLRRLEAEAIRDSLLAVSGKLDLQSFGPSVKGNTARRSIYVQVRRNALDPFLREFDFPEPAGPSGRRAVTNVPAQSLTMLNDPFVVSAAKAWATQVRREKNLSDADRVNLMFRQAFGRDATKMQVNDSLEYLGQVQSTARIVAGRGTEFRNELQNCRKSIAKLEQEGIERVLAGRKTAPQKPVDLKPVASWEFKEDLRDSVGQSHAKLARGAKTVAGALIVDGRGGYAVTDPLEFSLAAKTMEAWVRLDNLSQRGGGVMTVQTPDGNVFDSIVFGEQAAGEWLAGSDFFRRTQSFSGPKETEAKDQPVHLAIVYHGDGRIIGYRNGKPYGKAYRSDGPQAFAAKQTTVAFGVRHLPAGGKKSLAGRILSARLYDRALTAEEVAASAGATPNFVSKSQIMAALAAPKRKQVQELEKTIDKLEQQLSNMGPIPKAGNEAAWIELARALFSFKEFVYLK